MVSRNLLLVSACVIACGPTAAQEETVSPKASTANAELPEIDVTSPSPIKKPDKPKKTAASPAPATATLQSTVEDESFADGPSDAGEVEATTQINTVPGTLLVTPDTFASVTVTTRTELESNRGATITETLSQKPGIAGTTFAPGANRPILRGLDTYRVRVQEGGIGTHDVAALSEDHAVPVDPSSADRIEVIRGPATLRYGSSAIGGLVSIENQRVPTYIPKGGFSGIVSGAATSVDDGRNGSFEALAGIGGIAVHADGFKRDADDYYTPQGTQPNSFVESEGGSVGMSRIGNDGFIGVALVRFKSLYGIPGEEAAEEQPRIDLEQDKILAKGEWRPNAMGVEALRFWFGASDYAHNEVVEDGEIGSRFTNTEQELRTEAQHSPVQSDLGELRGAVGVHWSYQNLRAVSFEGDGLLSPNHTNVIAGYWFEELQASPVLRFQTAARIEQNEVDGFGLLDPTQSATRQFDRTFYPVSASLGALYDLPMNVEARLTGQYSERAPHAAELFSKGVHEATGTFEIGNPNLEKEKAVTAEFGLRKSSGPFRFDGTVYYTEFDGFIFKELTGVGCGDFITTCGIEDDLDQVVFIQRDATFYGVEIAAQFDVAPLWRGVWGIDGQYDYVRAEFSDGENVQRIPPQRLGGGLYYRDPQLFSRVGLLHAFEQDDIGVAETPTAGYTLLSAEAAYTFESTGPDPVAPNFTLGIKGENLLDDEVRNHASFKKDEVLLPGASVRVFGIVKLN